MSARQILFNIWMQAPKKEVVGKIIELLNPPQAVRKGVAEDAMKEGKVYLVERLITLMEGRGK